MNSKKWLTSAAAAAVLLGAFGPGRAEAQARVPQQRTRITNEDRKAAAEARKAAQPGAAAPSAPAGGTTVPVKPAGGAK